MFFVGRRRLQMCARGLFCVYTCENKWSAALGKGSVLEYVLHDIELSLRVYG